MCMMVICGKNFKRMPVNHSCLNLTTWHYSSTLMALNCGRTGLFCRCRLFNSLELPRSERYKKENCILVALIPPHCEGKGNMQKFRRSRYEPVIPLIDELKQLWNTGVILQRGITGMTLVRAALISVACDLPAVRKLCGFKAHGARQGCSRCSTHFGVESKRTVYGGQGFDTSAWSR